MSFWESLTLPTQDLYDDVEYCNPSDAYRLQIDAVNTSSELYAELEQIDEQLRKAETLEKEMVRAILAQNMAEMKGTQTRTNDLVDAFVFAAAAHYKTAEGKEVNLQPRLQKMRRRVAKLEHDKDLLERRLRAVNTVADICDRVLNWNKHLARLETGR